MRTGRLCLLTISSHRSDYYWIIAIQFKRLDLSEAYNCSKMCPFSSIRRFFRIKMIFVSNAGRYFICYAAYAVCNQWYCVHALINARVDTI